jgi:HEAT repeat protein
MRNSRKTCSFFNVLVLLTQIAVATALGHGGVSDLEPAFGRVAGYEYGQDFGPLAEVQEFVRRAKVDGDLHEALEGRMISFLKSQATPAGKRFICEQLSLIGTRSSVPVLAELLVVAETSDMARYTLERIQAPEADLALREALPRVSGKEQIGVVNTLGIRRDAAAVSLLAPFINHTDRALAFAAVNALGQIGNSEASKTLAGARRRLTGLLKEQVSDAYLRCLEMMARSGSKQEAAAGYRELSDPSEPSVIRVAALRGLTDLQGPQASGTLSKALAEKDRAVQATAIELLSAIPDSAGTPVLIARYPRLPVTGKVQVLTALTSRKDKSALLLATEALRDSSTEVKVAAIEGLMKVGDASHVILLAEMAAEWSDPVRTAARTSLYRLSAEGVDEVVLTRMDAAPSRVKAELIRAAGERRIEAASDILIRTAADTDSEVRRESRRALRDTAQPQHLPALLGLLDGAATATERADLETSLVFTLKRYEMAGIEQVLDAIGTAAPEFRASLIQVVGRTGYGPGLSLLREALKADEVEVQRAAILGLSEWPTVDPVSDLLAAAREQPSRSLQILALRGYVKLVALPGRRSLAESVRLLEEAVKLASQDEEKRAILSLLPRFACPEALALAETMKEGSVAEEAALAIERISRAIQTR